MGHVPVVGSALTEYGHMRSWADAGHAQGLVKGSCARWQPAVDDGWISEVCCLVLLLLIMFSLLLLLLLSKVPCTHCLAPALLPMVVCARARAFQDWSVQTLVYASCLPCSPPLQHWSIGHSNHCCFPHVSVLPPLRPWPCSPRPPSVTWACLAWWASASRLQSPLSPSDGEWGDSSTRLARLDRMA